MSEHPTILFVGGARDPDRWLVIGPDRAGNLLEIVVLITGTSDEIIIHAMPMRPKYRKLLQP